MTADESRREMVRNWLAMAEDALASARREQAPGPSAAVNRAYYACFYAASAVLLLDGRQFVKHTGVREAVHKHLVKTGRLTARVGQIYDQLMKNRHEADYGAVVRSTPEDAAEAVELAEEAVTAFCALLPTELGAS